MRPDLAGPSGPQAYIIPILCESEARVIMVVVTTCRALGRVQQSLIIFDKMRRLLGKF